MFSDDPAYIRAAESLLGDTIEVTNLSPKQEALRIPPRLIGIAAMSAGDPNIFDFLVRQDETLQEQYSYSPTLLPMHELDQKRIATKVQERMIALQASAEQCAKDLLAEEAAKQQLAKDKMERKLLKKKKHMEVGPENHLKLTSTNDDDDSASDVSLTGLLRPAATNRRCSDLPQAAKTLKEIEASMRIENHGSIDPSWTIVSKSSSSKQSQLQNAVATQCDTKEKGCKQASSSAADPIARQAESSPAGQSETAPAESPSNDEMTPNSIDSVSTQDYTKQLVENYQQDDTNAELHQQLAKERQETARLRAALVEADAMLQNLQLRLYISDTRLRTYEEALKAHVDQVKCNLSTEQSSEGNDMRPYEKESKLLKKGVVRRA